MLNIPDVITGLVAVSRDCFPRELSKNRRIKTASACRELDLSTVEIDTVVESENDVLKALREIEEKGINALVIYLGNFGPEGPATILADKFSGPVMFAAAAEESGSNLKGGRGDAFCGLLNASYNLGLRKKKVFMSSYPVGTPDKVAEMIAEFIPVARILIGLKNLKIFSFGPRPADFYACNAPIKPLFELGVEIMENSELDLYDIYRSAENDPAIPDIIKSMTEELGAGNAYPDLLTKLAQYEAGLLNFMNENLGASSFGIFANKCWPSFEKYFGFVPCFVNSRLTSRNIPVSCEVDIYGALSQYMITCATELPAAILDINNTVPDDMYIGTAVAKKYKSTDLFMGFHCGNAPSSCMVNPAMKYQLIMHRLMEPDNDPDITRGTLEGKLSPGETTIFRLQASAEGELRSYAAEGEIVDMAPRSFGSIGVFAIPELGRFYRQVLLKKQFPHHTAVAFKQIGKTLFNALGLLGVNEIDYNQPAHLLYEGENPFN